MSAVTTLLAIVQPLAEPAARAVLKLVQDALQGKDVRAQAEAVATLNGFKGAVSAAAERRREQLAAAIRRVSLFDSAGMFRAYVRVAGTPRVVLFEDRAYVAFGDFGITNSYREAPLEEGLP